MCTNLIGCVRCDRDSLNAVRPNRPNPLDFRLVEKTHPQTRHYPQGSPLGRGMTPPVAVLGKIISEISKPYSIRVYVKKPNCYLFTTRYMAG